MSRVNPDCSQVEFFKVFDGLQEVFPSNWGTVPLPIPRELQVIFGPPEVPVVRVFVGHLSSTGMPLLHLAGYGPQRNQQIVGVKPLFELKAAQILLYGEIGMLRDLQLVVPKNPGLERCCVLLLQKILRTKCGKRKLREFAYQSGYALPIVWLGGSMGFALRQSAIHDQVFCAVPVQTDGCGKDWVPWGRSAYRKILAAAEREVGEELKVAD